MPLARPRWGGIRLSHSGVWRTLKRHGLNTRRKRLGHVAGSAAPPDPTAPEPQPERPLFRGHGGVYSATHLATIVCVRKGALYVAEVAALHLRENTR